MVFIYPGYQDYGQYWIQYFDTAINIVGTLLAIVKRTVSYTFSITRDAGFAIGQFMVAKTMLIRGVSVNRRVDVLPAPG